MHDVGAAGKHGHKLFGAVAHVGHVEGEAFGGTGKRGEVGGFRGVERANSATNVKATESNESKKPFISGSYESAE